MDCPNIWWCPSCYRIVIHRGKRSRHESASYLGQNVHGALPKPDDWKRDRELTKFAWNDVDGVVWRREIGLLRFVEDKPSIGHLEGGQREVMWLLDHVVDHLKRCPDFALSRILRGTPERLHPDSGAWLMQGDPHEGNRLGAYRVTNVGSIVDAPTRLPSAGRSFTEEEELDALCWIPLIDDDHTRQFVAKRLANRRASLPLGTPEKIVRALIDHMGSDDLRTVAKLLTQATEQAA